jgi:hypothetical protein
MGVPTSEVGYTSATTGRGDHEVHKGHVVGGKNPEVFKFMGYFYSLITQPNKKECFLGALVFRPVLGVIWAADSENYIG